MNEMCDFLFLISFYYVYFGINLYNYILEDIFLITHYFLQSKNKQ